MFLLLLGQAMQGKVTFMTYCRL